MKALKIFLIVISVFSSCKENETKQNLEKVNINSLENKTVNINPKFDKNILSDIKKYYQNEYGKIAELEKEVNDSTYEISY